MAVILYGLAWLALVGSACAFLLSKCFFLAPYRVGWLMLIPNVVCETLERRLHVPRAVQDFTLLFLVPLGAWRLAGAIAGLLVALTLGAVWAGALLVERRWRSDRPARHYAPLKGRVPLPVPRLIVTLRGPVWRRDRAVYQLGDWPEGLTQSFELLVLNPGTVRPQLPLQIAIATACPRLRVATDGPVKTDCPEPGGITAQAFTVCARRYFLIDCVWFLRSPDRFTARPSFFWFVGRNLKYEIFSWADPAPVIPFFLVFFSRLLNPKERRFLLRTTQH